MKPKTLANAAGIGAFVVASILSHHSAIAQSNNQKSLSQTVTSGANAQVGNIIQISEPSFSEAEQFLQSTLGLTDDDELQLASEKSDHLGFTHYKYTQLYKGVVVDYRNVILHVKDGKIKRYSSNFLSINNLNVTPQLNGEDALKEALAHFDGKGYAWELDPKQERPKGELIIMHNSSSEQVHLTYKFDLYAYQPFKRAFVYVDAQSGKVISSISRIHHTDVAASGKSIYQGTVDFLADQTGPSAFRLRQATDSIETYSANNQWGWFNTSDITSTTATGPWNDSAAVQAHYGAEKTHGYYMTKHSRNSFDDQGSAIRSYVHIGVNYINAFWDGEKMSYGDGDTSVGPGYLPLVALDIVGHEITHGVTSHEANLLYEKESGALNESFSDIFGEAVERYAKGTNDWQLGTETGLKASGAIRSMDNPNLFNDPDTYLGTYWINTVGCIPNQQTNDLCGVHINSGVQNKWFYILSQGEAGTNDNGDSYNVTGIGMEKAAAIAYRNLTIYLTPTSTFHDARAGAIAAAEDLYGANSTESMAVADAWDAVGVSAGTQSTCAKSLYSTANTYTTIAFFGYYFDVVATNNITINDFLVNYYSFGSPLTDSIEVYTRAGSYKGNSGSLVGWTYVGKTTMTTGALGTLVQMNLGANINVGAGNTQAFLFMNTYGIVSGNQSSGLVSSSSAPVIAASNPDLMWMKGAVMGGDTTAGADTSFAVWGEICYDVNNSCPAVNMTFTPYNGAHFLPQLDPYTFYFGTTQWKRIRMSHTGGVGPFTYSWGKVGTGQLKGNLTTRSIYLYEPFGPTDVYATVYDAGTGCSSTDTISIGWDDQYFCGSITPRSYELVVCEGGITKCVKWKTAKSLIKNGQATIGPCPVPKTNPDVNNGITVYPNPSAGEFTIEHQAEDYGTGELAVFDLNGRMVYHETVNLIPGVSYFELDLSSMTNGLYIVKVSDNNNVHTSKIQILK